ncbi:acetate/propionate family kinase [Buchnera aphidicola]|uniref:acetate/propionate family kinase n=1 Tax=Buchnera aphidicola TaxID=9 RepID=UPI00094C7CC7|nr:acetate/propionate family kinase [Buchnera aphidicola]
MKEVILVLNCGSSSVKFSIINPIKKISLIQGIVETIQGVVVLSIQDFVLHKKTIQRFGKIEVYEQLIVLIFDLLSKRYKSYLDSLIGIGHRVVHGGQNIKTSMIINDQVLLSIQKASIFAPLHNPYHLLCIKVSLQKILKLKNCNVAVFDTSFHQTMPKISFLYAIPYYFYSNHAIRRYGAHGINHLYITHQCALMLKKSIDRLNIISCHLGGGSSITAIVEGKSIDTSMGLTPLEGLAMGTRCGDIDPYIIFYMVTELSIPLEEVKKILTEKSGVLGISALTSDFRELERNYFTNKRAKLSIDIFCNRVSKYIGGYFTSMPKKLDAVVFTGGIGENSSFVRQKVVEKLSLLGCFIDNEKNSIHGLKNRRIHSSKSIPILVIPANENQMIAQETYALLKNL